MKTIVFLFSLFFFFSIFFSCFTPRPKKPPLPEVTTSQQFYMVFRSLPDSASQADFIAKYPVLARQSFYKHIIQMIQDRSFKVASPIAFDQAREAGEKLGKLYTIKFNDPTLEQVFNRIPPLE